MQCFIRFKICQKQSRVVQLGRQLDKPLHEYKTVAFVRNPWDWTVSGYLHVTQNMPAYDHPPTFRDFVLGDWGHPTILQYPKKFTTANAYVEYHTQITPWQHLFGPERNVKIDRLCTFEALADDVRDVFGTTNELPHANKSERRHYSEYYDEETQFITAERHQELIEAFGYRFARP